MRQRRSQLQTIISILDELRCLISHSITAKLPQHADEAIHNAAQLIVHRLVFLRFCQNNAVNLISQPLSSWSDFQAICQQLATRFPQSVFRANPIIDPPVRPCVDAVAFATAIAETYSQLNFQSLALEDLGAIYEQHLSGLNNRSRKHQGVFYTPKYVVDYIIEHTIGIAIQNKSPDEIATLRFADIACGSGAFLLGIYECLEKYLIAWFRSHPTEQYAVACVDGVWRLAPHYQSQILLNNLFAVDLDPQAVEVAKMSLHLKLLLSTTHEIDLPSLAANIQCGNALVSDDYLVGHDEQNKIKPFNWATNFPAVMNAGGFHAIIGNPPYVNIRLITQSHGPQLKAYFREHFTCAQRGYDLYILFLEQAFCLLQPDGRCGMIIPNKLATLDYAAHCRELLAQQTRIERIADLSSANVFPAASVYPYILISSKHTPAEEHRIAFHEANSAEELNADHSMKMIRQIDLQDVRGWKLQGGLEIEARVSTTPLSALATIYSGTTGFSAEAMAHMLVEAEEQPPAEYYAFIVSGNVDRYHIRLGNVRFMHRQFSRPLLARRSTGITDNKHRLFTSAKIIIAGMTKRLEAAYDPGGLALGVQLFAVLDARENLFYLLGLLNSKLLSYLFRTRFRAKQLAGGYLAINKGQLAQLPIRVIENENDRANQDEIIELAKRMSQEPSDAIDTKIDTLVYELHHLTAEEIAQVEAGYTANN